MTAMDEAGPVSRIPRVQSKLLLDEENDEPLLSVDGEGEGLEVVAITGGDGEDDPCATPEFDLPDMDGSSKPLDPSVLPPRPTSESDALESGAPKPPSPPPEQQRAGRSSSAGNVQGGGGGADRSNNRRRYRRSASANDATAQQAAEAKKLGYVQMARLGYQELVNAIIRPPRAEYREESMGPTSFGFCGRHFRRRDFVLRTERGYNLRCSYWEPLERPAERIPVVVYMHGNSSARVEVVPQLSYLLSLGLAVFSFDFAGSGKSDGEYVSLGYYEREDLMCVIAFLRSTRAVSTIALWGRSMGAATALMHGDRDPSIACMVLDSPFADLTQLAEEMVERGKQQGINVPNFVTAVALRMIRGSVKKQANFDIRAISPISHADRCFIPALFVAGEHDDFISKRHSEIIHARYAGDKNLIVVEGDHNSPRPKFMFDSVSIFLQTCLQLPSSWALRVPPGMNLMAPPWFFPGSVLGGVDSVPAANEGGGGGTNSGPSSRNPSRRGSSVSGTSRRSALSRSASRSGGRGRDNRDETAAAAASASASAGGPDNKAEDMGMTVERQREIQASLFKMLGQSEENSTGGASGGASRSNGSSRRGSSRSRVERTRSSSSSVTSAERTPSQTTTTAAATSARVEGPIGAASSE